MKLLIIIYLKTQSMKKNWKTYALYVLRFLELLITGAIGGAASQL